MRRNRPNLHTREPSHVGERLRRSLGEANEPIDPRPLGHGPPFPAYHRFRTDPEHTLQLRLGKAGAFSKIPNLHRRQKSLALSNLPCRGPAGDASLTCSIELGPTTPALRPVVFELNGLVLRVRNASRARHDLDLVAITPRTLKRHGHSGLPSNLKERTVNFRGSRWLIDTLTYKSSPQYRGFMTTTVLPRTCSSGSIRLCSRSTSFRAGNVGIAGRVDWGQTAAPADSVVAAIAWSDASPDRTSPAGTHLMAVPVRRNGGFLACWLPAGRQVRIEIWEGRKLRAVQSLQLPITAFAELVIRVP